MINWGVSASFANRYLDMQQGAAIKLQQVSAKIMEEIDFIKSLDPRKDPGSLDRYRQKLNTSYCSFKFNEKKNSGTGNESNEEKLKETLKPDFNCVWVTASEEEKKSILIVKIVSEYVELFSNCEDENKLINPKDVRYYEEIKRVVGYNLQSPGYFLTWQQMADGVIERLEAIKENKALKVKSKLCGLVCHRYFKSGPQIVQPDVIDAQLAKNFVKKFSSYLNSVEYSQTNLPSQGVNKVYKSDNLDSSQDVSLIQLFREIFEKFERYLPNQETKDAISYDRKLSGFKQVINNSLNFKYNEFCINGGFEKIFLSRHHKVLIAGLTNELRQLQQAPFYLGRITLYKDKDFELAINSKLRLVYLETKESSTNQRAIKNEQVIVDLRDYNRCREFLDFIVTANFNSQLLFIVAEIEKKVKCPKNENRNGISTPPAEQSKKFQVLIDKINNFKNNNEPNASLFYEILMAYLDFVIPAGLNEIDDKFDHQSQLNSIPHLLGFIVNYLFNNHPGKVPSEVTSFLSTFKKSLNQQYENIKEEFSRQNHTAIAHSGYIEIAFLRNLDWLAKILRCYYLPIEDSANESIISEAIRNSFLEQLKQHLEQIYEKNDGNDSENEIDQSITREPSIYY